MSPLGGKGGIAPPSSNRFLSLLSPEVVARLTPHLEAVELERREVLFRAHEPLHFAYFPLTAVVSLLASLKSGETLEVGLIGRDGVVGAAVIPNAAAVTYDAVVQVPGLALRMLASDLREAAFDNKLLVSLLGRHAQLLLARSMQITLCNTFHPVEQRCIRWLLTVQDLISRDDIPLTHDTLAAMLGVRRPTVTLVLGALERSGLLDEARGRILLRDRERLEAASCECYRAMCDEQERLLGYGCREQASI